MLKKPNLVQLESRGNNRQDNIRDYSKISSGKLRIAAFRLRKQRKFTVIRSCGGQ